MQRSIRNQIYSLQGIAVIGSGLDGTIDDQISHINTLRDLAISNHEQLLSMEQELYDRRLSLTRSLADYATGLRLGSNSALSNSEKLSIAQGQFRSLSSRALDESLSADERLLAAEGLQGAADAYIEAGRTNFASSAAYKAIFNEVLGVVEGVSGSIAPSAAFDPAQANAALQAELEGLQAQLSNISTGINDRIISELFEIRGSILSLPP